MWSRQVARAAGASLIAPLVLLLAAGVVASGGGLGGFDSLRQIASGPSLPDTGLNAPSTSSIKDAEIVGADVAPRAAPVRADAPPARELASADPPPSAPPASPTARPRPRAQLDSPSGAPGVRTPTPVPGEEALLNDTEETPVRPAPGPVDELQETTRGLGESLTEPLAPVGNQLLDLVRFLVPPPR